MAVPKKKRYRGLLAPAGQPQHQRARGCEAGSRKRPVGAPHVPYTVVVPGVVTPAQGLTPIRLRPGQGSPGVGRNATPGALTPQVLTTCASPAPAWHGSLAPTTWEPSRAAHPRPRSILGACLWYTLPPFVKLYHGVIRLVLTIAYEFYPPYEVRGWVRSQQAYYMQRKLELGVYWELARTLCVESGLAMRAEQVCTDIEDQCPGDMDFTVEEERTCHTHLGRGVWPK